MPTISDRVKLAMNLTWWLVVTFLVDWVLVEMTIPRRSAGLHGDHYLVMLIIPLGAFCEGRRFGTHWLFTNYGCLGAFLFLQEYLSTPRLGVSLNFGDDRIARIVAGWALFSLFMGVLARWASIAGAHFAPRKRVNAEGHLVCQHCGYILNGLFEPRCPECGNEAQVDMTLIAVTEGDHP